MCHLQKTILLMGIDDLYINLACRTTSKFDEQLHAFEKIDASGVILKGQVNDTERIKRIIKDYLAKHKIKIKKIYIALKSEKVMIRYMELPNIPEKELKDAIYNKLEEEFSYNLSEFVIDYTIGTNSNIMVVIVAEKIIYDYIVICKELGLTLIKMDIFQNCIAQAFAKANENMLLVDKCNDKLNLLYMSDGFIYHSRYIRSLEYQSVQAKLRQLTNHYGLHTNLRKVCMLSEGIDFVSDYFCSIGIQCEVYPDSDKVCLQYL